jgi:hypothetical protein
MRKRVQLPPPCELLEPQEVHQSSESVVKFRSEWVIFPNGKKRRKISSIECDNKSVTRPLKNRSPAILIVDRSFGKRWVVDECSVISKLGCFAKDGGKSDFPNQRNPESCNNLKIFFHNDDWENQSMNGHQPDPPVINLIHMKKSNDENSGNSRIFVDHYFIVFSRIELIFQELFHLNFLIG